MSRLTRNDSLIGTITDADNNPLSWANVSASIFNALCKLKEYEDTGLTPEEVQQLTDERADTDSADDSTPEETAKSEPAKIGYVIFITPDSIKDGVSIVKVDAGSGFISDVHMLVGGHVEAIRLDKNAIMLVDEEGKFKSYSSNPIATRLLHEAYKTPLKEYAKDAIWGNAVIVKSVPNDFAAFDNRDYVRRVIMPRYIK